MKSILLIQYLHKIITSRGNVIWDQSKINFEWISHKCKMLFNILFSIHLTSLFFVIYPFESVHFNSPVVTVLCIWLRVGGGYGKYFFFFSLFLYVNIEMYRIICWIRVHIYTIYRHIIHFFFIFLHPLLSTSMRVYFYCIFYGTNGDALFTFC